MRGEEGGNPSEEGLSSLLPRTPSSHLPKTFVLIESPISGGRMNGIFWGLFFPVKGTPSFVLERITYAGVRGGRLPHRAGLRGGSPCRRRPHHRLFAQGSAGWGGPLPQGAIPLPLGPSRSAWRPLRLVPYPGCGCAKAGADVQVSHAIQNNTL